MLENITSPKDIKGLDKNQITELCREIRSTIVATVDKNGGHLASNLGITELTVALHRVFDCPKDKLIFDVGHQCYAHKLLTGRAARFDTLRTHGGISGLSNREESDYDTVTAGHSGPSLSVSLGIAQAAKLVGDDNYTVCVVGDGSFTNGMIYEALNNCDDTDLRLIIVLNDNEMSISRNVGALSGYFRKIRSSKGYFTIKAGAKHAVSKIPGVGKGLVGGIRAIKNGIKKVIVKNNFFECLGLEYIGPVNGHDEKQLELALKEAKTKRRVTIVHVITKKGKGYASAEQSPEKFHGVAPEAERVNKQESFSHRFGDIVCRIAKEDDKLCCVTAAMCEGTGLYDFRAQYPERFFDVGIAEEHALTFSSGLSIGGFKPICVLYSTFAQRVYDQLMHDVCLQNTPMIITLDRAGVVPQDGVTHQGIFDVSIFSSLPGVQIYSPESFAELEQLIKAAVSDYSGIKIIRYPKGADAPEVLAERDMGSYTVYGSDNPEVLAVTYGRLADNVRRAADMAANTRVVKLKKLIPLEIEAIKAELCGAGRIEVFEDGAKSGGVGEKLAADLQGVSVSISAIEGFPTHGTVEELYKDYKLDADSIYNKLNNNLY